MFALIHSINFEIQAGKGGAVDFSTGPEPMVYKAKNGHLMVVSWALSLLSHVSLQIGYLFFFQIIFEHLLFVLKSLNAQS